MNILHVPNKIFFIAYPSKDTVYPLTGFEFLKNPKPVMRIAAKNSSFSPILHPLFYGVKTPITV
jgi:hypothetical protein